MSVSNIVRAVVKLGSNYTVTAPIVKEDYGLYLQIEGVELPPTYQVDFSNSESNGTSVTMIGNSDGVLIPRQFIDTGKDIFAFLYHVGADFGRTVYKFRIPNKVRPDRTDDEPTPEEQSTIDQLIGAMNTAVAQTAQDKADADASAQSASADAERAEDAKTDAQNFATQAEQATDDAQTYANNASASATASAQSASQSAQIKSDVEDLVDDARGYAQASERSASASANSASQAQGYAQSASASAQSASGYATQAQTSAQSASADADRAEQAKEDASTFAQRSANSTQASADYSASAQASATASAQSAEQSAINSADAQDSADDAQGYASASVQSATASANSASQALSSAQSASASASSAQGYASQAQTSAQTASTKASEASASASTASTKATEASQSASQALSYKTDAESAKTASQTAQELAESARDSAVQAKTDAESAKADAESARNEAVSAVASISGALDDKADVITDSASGAVASFTDGADGLPLKSLVVNIDPVQDLHGYDSPWVGGGGKNKINAPDVTISSGSYLYNGALVLPAGTYTLSFTSSTGASTSASIAITDADGTAMVTGGHVIPYTFTLPNASANVKIYVSGAGTYTNIQIEEGSSATAYAPYENICPISGWTQVDVEQSGRNLFDNGMTLEDGYISPDTGQVTASQNAYNKHTPLIPIAPSISLVANKVQALAANNSLKTFFAGWAYYDINKNFISGKWNPSAIDTPPTNARFLALSVTGSATNNAYFTPEAIADFVKDYCLAYGSTATPYSPYTGRSITINLGQTVYGGKVDVLSGVLTVDRAMAVFDGTETFRNNWFPTVVCAKAFPKGDALGNSFVNSHLPSLGVACDYATSGKTNFQFGKANEYWGVSSADELKTIFAQQYANGTPVTICYPLAEPIEIQLSANQINSLYGQNNIWADSGDTEVEYRADTKLFIERLTAPDSADMIADANITSGQYFMVGNSLYKATANIANGGQITVGTNCTRVSLAQALNEINA